MNIEDTGPTRLKLYGTYGSFKTTEEQIQLNYLLTVANGRDGGVNSELLEHLKPMRERVRLEEISSLEEILQRDVNDSRVASGIVDYLIGGAERKELPSFFPSIVVVLLPRNIFSNPHAYPKGDFDSKSKVVDYDGAWTFEPVESNGKPTVIGKLELDVRRVWPVVIDGQHRTVGFRFVAGANTTSVDTEIYDKFYVAQEGRRPVELNADLPVTLVWFDSQEETELDVLEFCRRLFLDINQSSQQIAESRKILLSDSDPLSLLTRGFYDWVVREKKAKRGESLSLIHTGFDFPENLKKRLDWSPLSVFVPELFRFALMQFLLLRSQENTSGKRRGKLVGLASGWLLDSSMFDFVLGKDCWRESVVRKEDIEENEYFVIKGREAQEAVIGKANSNLYSRLWEILDVYGPIACVVKGVAATERERIDRTGYFDSAHPMSGTRIEVWDKIFCGGTGLFYSLRKSNQVNVDSLKQEMRACADDLVDHTASSSGLDRDEWLLVRSKLLTKAGLIGFLMAYKHVSSQNLKFSDGHQKFLESMGRIDWASKFYPFVIALSKWDYIKDLDPKAWTVFRDLVLIFLNDEKGESIASGVQASFERNIFLHQLDVKLKGHASSKGISVPDARAIMTSEKWTDDLSKSDFDSWSKGLQSDLIALMKAGGFAVSNNDWSYAGAN